MTDFRFESEELDDPEVVSELEMEDYEKYRLKQGDITVDVAIVDLADRETEEYIEQRKEEISGSETEVPHPYKPEKQSKEGDDQLVDFSGRQGEGFAGPEYNLVPAEGEGIARYDYFITWKEFGEEEKLVEVEIYAPNGKRNRSELEDLVRSLRLE